MKTKMWGVSRKLLSVAICLAMLATAVLAADWHLEDGQITVTANESGQTVTQNGGSAPDDNPRITGTWEGGNGPAVTIKTEGNAQAQITLDNVDILSRNDSGIEVGDANAVITVDNTKQNKNGIYHDNDTENGGSRIYGETGIHVTTGSLTINGGTPGSARPEDPERDNIRTDLSVSGDDGAAIGSQQGESMSGDITITGNVAIDADGWGGAAVGSGRSDSGKKSLDPEKTEMSGNLTVSGNAEVFVSHGSNAGLGSGRDSVMSGTVSVIENGAVYEGDRRSSGATIGAGVQHGVIYRNEAQGDYFQDDGGFTGQILLGRNSQVDYVKIPRNAISPESSTHVTIGNGNEAAFDSMQDMEISGKQEASPEVLADGTRGSITIEKGAVLEGTVVQSHADADPYLNCFVQTGKNDPVTMNHINVYIVDGSRPSQPGETLRQGTFYWVTENGKPADCTAQIAGDVLTITTEAENAELHCSVYGLHVLQQQGIRTVVFKTASLSSSFAVAEAAADRSGDIYLLLAHKDGKAAMTAGEEDISGLLQ